MITKGNCSGGARLSSAAAVPNRQGPQEMETHAAVEGNRAPCLNSYRQRTAGLMLESRNATLPRAQQQAQYDSDGNSPCAAA